MAPWRLSAKSTEASKLSKWNFPRLSVLICASTSHVTLLYQTLWSLTLHNSHVSYITHLFLRRKPRRNLSRKSLRRSSVLTLVPGSKWFRWKTLPWGKPAPRLRTLMLLLKSWKHLAMHKFLINILAFPHNGVVVFTLFYINANFKKCLKIKIWWMRIYNLLREHIQFNLKWANRTHFYIIIKF